MQAPAFLNKPTVTKKIISKIIHADKTKGKDANIGSSFVLRDIANLESNRNYYYNTFEQLKLDVFPYVTVGGAIVGSQLFGKKNATAGVLMGGIVGYMIDKKLQGNRAQQIEQMKIACLQKIKEIDKQLSILKASELKEATAPKEENIIADKNNIVLSSLAVNTQDIPVYELTTPYKDFIGNPTINFSAIIYGLPKSGKSNFAIAFASYLVKTIGKVLYVASEEGLVSRPLQEKIRYNLAENKDLYFTGATDLNGIKEAIKTNDYKFVFIDSINRANLSADDLEKLKAGNKDKAFISIMQSTKGGDFKGAQEFAHNCDIVINVSDGIASQVGRFNGASQMNIFPR
jgi:hypothetical protein